jgi:hypothetical protein
MLTNKKRSAIKPVKTKFAAVAGYIASIANLLTLIIVSNLAAFIFSARGSSANLYTYPYSPFGEYNTAAIYLFFFSIFLIVVSMICQMIVNRKIGRLGRVHGKKLLQYGGNTLFIRDIIRIIALIFIATSINSPNPPYFALAIFGFSYLVEASGYAITGFGFLKLAKQNEFYFYEINLLKTHAVLYLIRGFGGFLLGPILEILSPVYLGLSGWMLWNWRRFDTAPIPKRH